MYLCRFALSEEAHKISIQLARLGLFSAHGELLKRPVVPLVNTTPTRSVANAAIFGRVNRVEPHRALGRQFFSLA
jgi:hypothetical protein